VPVTTAPGFNPHCEFCKITQGGAPAEVVARSRDCVAFLPDEPATLGHTLIAPIVHVEDLWAPNDYPELAHAVLDLALRVGRALDHVLDPEGLNLISSAGAAASQTVKHLHVHVVPRWSGDRIGEIWPEGPDPSVQTRRTEIAASLRSYLQ
jgi:histidine triad (HIT) family protein